MLVRTYRLSDKLGILLIKLGIALSDHLLAGANVVVSLFVWLLKGLFGAVLLVLLGIARALGAVLRRFWLILRAVTGVVQRGSSRMLRVSQRAATSATATAGTSMARRAARAEIDQTLAEDPLRVQNRMLSVVVVLLVAAVIGVFLWATDPSRTSTTPPLLVNAGAPSAGVATPDSGNVSSAAIPGVVPSAVPTATDLPPVLAVRGSLAYTVRELGQTDIWVMSIGSRTPLRLTNSPEDERDPAWSPDGRQIAYASRQDSNWELYIYDFSSGETRRLTYDQSFQGNPHWSPDGQWLVYESYQSGSLDIFIMRADASEQIQLTSNPAPDFSPVWSPDSRRIAFVSWRDGNQDIYLFNLDDPRDEAVLNITSTPARHEDHPAWSPDGALLAYSAFDEGREKVFVKSATEPDSAPQVIAFGRTPAWSPDGTSLVFAVDSLDDTQLVAGPFAGQGTLTQIIPVPLGSTAPDWTTTVLPLAFVNSGGLNPGVTEPLYVEQVERQSTGRFGLDQMVGVAVPPPAVNVLNDRVNDSFNALRQRTLTLSGWDFLGTLDDAFWSLDRRPAPGEPRRNWHMTGRAFSVTRNAIAGFPPLIEVVREDIGVDTYWRVYVRVDEDAQFGQLGEPLRHMPWDFAARDSGDVEAYNQGGRLRAQMPGGYYLDFTQLALDYGWLPMPAGSDWRANFAVVNYWMFIKTDSLLWIDAMLELYAPSELGGFAPTATPAPALPTATPAASDTGEGE